MSEPTYTAKDCGCWVDGAFGTNHAVAQLRRMLLSVDRDILTVEHRELAELEPGDGLACWSDSEFVSDHEDDLTDALYSYTEPGLSWVWDAGDLLLLTDGADTMPTGRDHYHAG